MKTKQQNNDTATRVDMKLEVEIIPVSDVERSKRFYQRLSFRETTIKSFHSTMQGSSRRSW